MKTRIYPLSFLTGVLFFVNLFVPFVAQGEARARLSKGQSIYVPAYSHIYSGDKALPFLLTVTLSIRNIDPKYSMRLLEVDYHETQGARIKRLLDASKVLKPMESMRFVIPESDASGGSGANFIVTWSSDKLVNAPIVESIMIGTKSQQGVSFSSRGQPILTHKE